MHFPINFIFLFTLSPLWIPSIALESDSTDPIPSPWPHQFHATTIMNYTGGLRKVDLWYDWPNKRYLHINQYQLGKKLYGVEWQNGTSFYFTLDSTEECTIRHFPVGILRPNWLEGANYMGQRYKDGFLCNVWDKVDFIHYYEDVATQIPVYWHFHDELIEHIITFEVGKVLENSKWQAPAYCFNENEKGKKTLQDRQVQDHSLLTSLFHERRFKSEK